MWIIGAEEERMHRRVILFFLAAGSPLICVTLLVGGPIAEWVFVLVSLLFPVALMALGVRRRGRFGRTIALQLVVGLILEAASIGILVLSANAGESWVLGLPASTVLMLLGLGLVPLVVVSLGFAATFDSFGLTSEEIERISSLKDLR